MRLGQGKGGVLTPGINLFVASAHGQVDEILRSIEQERSNSVVVENGGPSVRVESAKPTNKKQLSSRASHQEKNQPAVKVWGPKDRLPGNIAGQYLIGDFMVLGEYVEGGAVIYAVEDDGNVFIRQFVVKNASSGLAPGVCYPDGQKPRVRFTRSNPLVFLGKLFPGLYAVQSSR